MRKKKNKRKTTARILLDSGILACILAASFFLLNFVSGRLPLRAEIRTPSSPSSHVNIETLDGVNPTYAPEIEAADSGSAFAESGSEDQKSTEEISHSGEGTLSPTQGTSAFSGNDAAGLEDVMASVQSLLPQDNGQWAAYVCSLSDGAEGSLNNARMQAASLIKLYIMGAVYENYDKLAAAYGSGSLDSNLHYMITVSDNDAANTLVSYLGGGDSSAGMNVVNLYCAAHGYGQSHMGRLLLAPNTYDDNYTSVEDCGLFLKEIYMAANGLLAETSLSHPDAMYNLLKQQERQHKIPAMLPAGVHVANKTGELSDVENDAGIIYDTSSGNDLVVCFMSQNLRDAYGAQNSISQMSRYIYSYFNE